MKLTEPQKRMLAVFADETTSIQRWKLLQKSGSHNSGYRVLDALLFKGAVCCVGYDWYRRTPEGRVAVA